MDFEKIGIDLTESDIAKYGELKYAIARELKKAYQQGIKYERELCEEVINGYMVESVESMELKEKTDVLEFFNQHLKKIVEKIKGI